MFFNTSIRRVFLCMDTHNVNSEYLRPFFIDAINKLGWRHSKLHECDFAIMWGPQPELTLCRNLNKPVLVCDFPYWNRGNKKRDGKEYYKISLNGQHPTEYLMKEKFNNERYLQTNSPEIMPWKKTGKYILLAGAGIKAQRQYKYSTQEWEKSVVNKIKPLTSLPIIYRPKPQKIDLPKIAGTTHDPGKGDIRNIIRNAYAVVCHHGNPTIDALSMGIPIFMNGKIGAASHLAELNLENINNPLYPDGREQFFYNLAYWQWSVSEIKNGTALRSYLERGLI